MEAPLAGVEGGGGRRRVGGRSWPSTMSLTRYPHQGRGCHSHWPRLKVLSHWPERRQSSSSFHQSQLNFCFNLSLDLDLDLRWQWWSKGVVEDGGPK